MGGPLGSWSRCSTFLVALAYAMAGGGAGAMAGEGADCSLGWTLVDSPIVADGTSALGALAVIAPDDIWAAGNYTRNGGHHPLIEHWNGSAWSVVPSPDGPRPITWLTGIAAAAYGTLIERYTTSCVEGRFVRGDASADGQVNIADAVTGLNYLFLGGAAPPCLDAADNDDNGELNVTDAIRLLNHLFLGGLEPPSPGIHSCGSDPTPDRLPACADSCP